MTSAISEGSRIVESEPIVNLDPAVVKEIEGEVISAIRSLYDDALKPYGRIIRIRLKEQLQLNKNVLSGDLSNEDKLQSDEGNDLDDKCFGVDIEDCVGDEKNDSLAPVKLSTSTKSTHLSFSLASGEKVDLGDGALRQLCGQSAELEVHGDEGNEWHASLVDREPDFVDFYSIEDPFSAEFWLEAESYFDNILETTGGGRLPGGRYASACELKRRDPEFLAALSLGQICHVMQLAMNQRSLLGHCKGAIVPYKYSRTMMQRRCAEEKRPFQVEAPENGITQDKAVKFADWDFAQECLKEIMLTAASYGTTAVPLSNIKRHFRSKYDVELSETALGYSKLSALLKDDRFSSICSVRLQDRGYVAIVHPELVQEGYSMTAMGSTSSMPGSGYASRRGSLVKVGQGVDVLDDLEAFMKNGAVLELNTLPREELVTVSAQTKANADEAFASLFALSAYTQAPEDYQEISHVGRGRYDIRWGVSRRPFPQMAQSGPWLNVVQSILGDEIQTIACGILVSRGDQVPTDQVWRSDCEHLYDDVQVPPHCVKVLIPLTDLSDETGAVDIVLGSHMLSFDASGEVFSTSVMCKAGTVIIHDSRVLYRTSANHSGRHVHFLYYTYAKPWFKNRVPWPSKSLLAEAKAHQAAFQ